MNLVIISGATGMTGNELSRQLLKDGNVKISDLIIFKLCLTTVDMPYSLGFGILLFRALSFEL